MKLTIKITAVCLALTGLAACKRELIQNPEQYTRVYMPQAIDYPVQKSLVMTDTLQTIYFGAAYGGVNDQPQALMVTFKASPELVDSFNRKNGTSYTAMPQGSFQLERSEAVVQKGDFNTQALQIKVKTVGGIEPLKDYLLPVNIESVSPALAINENLRTTYFKIRGTYEDFSRANWSIASASSFEPTNPTSNAIDDNANTWWFTQWRAAQPGPPHNIVIDMGETKKLHGVYILPLKQASGNPQSIHIDVSSDQMNWQAAGDYTLTNNPERQDVYFAGAVEGRYFRVVINSSYGNKYFTYIAEIGAF